MYIYVCACVYTYIHKYSYPSLYLSIHPSIYLSIDRSIYICILTYPYFYIYKHRRVTCTASLAALLNEFLPPRPLSRLVAVYVFMYI